MSVDMDAAAGGAARKSISGHSSPGNGVRKRHHKCRSVTEGQTHLIAATVRVSSHASVVSCRSSTDLPPDTRGTSSP